MIEAPHYSATGAKKKSVSLPDALFDGTVNEHALHRAVVTFLANQRQGTHDTKTRRWVTGGNQKPWRQKGTGRARQGSIRAPHWRHGGIVFGPHPRDYRLAIPKKIRQLAKKSTLFRSPGPRGGATGGGSACVREAEDQDAGRVAREPGARGPQGAGADGGRRAGAQRGSLGPQPSRRPRDAVRRRDGVRDPVVGRRGGGAARAGLGGWRGRRG